MIENLRSIKHVESVANSFFCDDLLEKFTARQDRIAYGAK